MMQNDLINIPYIAHESEVARQERTIKRLWILSIVIFLAFVISNASWIVYESSYSDTYVEQEVDTGEGSAIVIGTGGYNGESATNSENTN